MSSLNPPNIELDVVHLLASIEEVERSTFWDEQNSLEFKLPLNREVIHGKMVFPIIGQALVEGSILLLGDLLCLSQPDGFQFVDELPLMRNILNLLLLGLLFFILLIDVLNISLLFLLGLIVLIITDLFLGCLLSP